MKSVERYQQARNITLVGALINAIQGGLKFFFGFIGQSHALIADGVHSLSDLITDILVIFAARYGSQSADSEHPYGHGRIETAATVALAILIILAGVGIMYGSAEHFFTTKTIEIPRLYTLIIAIFSAVANEIIFRLTLYKAKSIKHQLLEANAWHHRSDAASSGIVVLGIGGSLLGWVYLDVIAAFVIGIMIIKMGWELAWSNVQELIDTGLDQPTLDAIKKTIKQVPGVHALHQLRTRKMAGNILVDVHILVAGQLSVSEGHYIATQVHAILMEDFPDITDVTVHVDPENDEVTPSPQNLPSRNSLNKLLESRWKQLKGYDVIYALNIHYLNGKLILEVVLPLSVLSHPTEKDALRAAYLDAVKGMEGVEAVYLLFR